MGGTALAHDGEATGDEACPGSRGSGGRLSGPRSMKGTRQTLWWGFGREKGARGGWTVEGALRAGQRVLRRAIPDAGRDNRVHRGCREFWCVCEGGLRHPGPRLGHRVRLYQPGTVEARQFDAQWLRRAQIRNSEVKLRQNECGCGSLPRGGLAQRTEAPSVGGTAGAHHRRARSRCARGSKELGLCGRDVGRLSRRACASGEWRLRGGEDGADRRDRGVVGRANSVC
jgi:hypothetical protein